MKRMLASMVVVSVMGSAALAISVDSVANPTGWRDVVCKFIVCR